MKFYESILLQFCRMLDIPIDIPYGKLSSEQRKLVLYGIPESGLKTSTLSKGKREIVRRYEGIVHFLERKYREGSDNEMMFKRIAPFLVEKPCEACEGYRLRPESLRVFIDNQHIGQLSNMSVKEALLFFHHLQLSPQDKSLAGPVIKNIRERLEFLKGV